MTGEYGLAIFPQHQKLLRESAISVEVAKERGYVSVDTKARLESAGFSPHQRRAPGLLIPVHDEHGTVALYQYRPDNPRSPKAGSNAGKAIKYETPKGARMVVDVPPRVRPLLGDPKTPLWVTEGSRKADAAVTAGLACVALLGVWNWRGANTDGGKVALAFWESVALNGRRVYIAFDSDAMTKKGVHDALARFGPYLTRRGADVAYVYLPAGNGAKVGLDDYLADGGVVDDLVHTARSEPLAPVQEELPEPETVATVTPLHRLPEPAKPVDLARALETFGKWLHIDDNAPVLVVAATVVANNAEGDPLWLLLVGPPSSGKTETLSATAGLRYMYSAATVTEASLLSAVSVRERDKNATGGLLRQIGDYGIILCKDFTSVLSQNRDASRAALAALREVYDGSWDRPTGSGGGQVLSWSGKCGLVGGVTPSIDAYTQVVGALGDRYVLLRLPDVDPASMAASALALGGVEKQMRAELAETMTGLIAGADASKVSRPLDDDEIARLVSLSTFTARARTAVERDSYSKDVTVLPQAEGTGRIVGQFRRLYGGLEAIGCDLNTAWKVLYRVAIDCVPRLRMKVMRTLLDSELYLPDLRGNRDRPDQLTTGRVAAAVGVDWKTANRHLEDLRLLGLAELDIEEKQSGEKPTYWWSASVWLNGHMPTPGGLDLIYPPSKNEKENTYANSENDGQENEHESPHPGARTRSPDPSTSSDAAVREGTAVSGHQDHEHVPLDFPDTPPVCHACEWPINSNAHATNCEGAAA